MNKKINTVTISLFFFLLIGCNNSFILQQRESDKPIIVRLNKKYEKIIAIQFPFQFVIENKTFLKKEFGEINYEYGYNDKGAYIDLFQENKKITNNQLKIVQGKTDLEFLVYTIHFLDSLNYTQQTLKPYIQKMLELNQDTLCIGTVAEFKEKHSELFKMLTENDTISIRYLKNKNSGLGERIAIPANW